ncbi:cytochrome c oxidase accessory protein CcoG [Leucothrix mucor]|uniref:cytochrome c oxidase accessory protein CcoG n=1 Tax=Leucothrix mucor TaxID=45248 RepID=UPI0003B4D68D|nr:cytochrome c oxidase accessory protein CcoG [Leucothrix mucor]
MSNNASPQPIQFYKQHEKVYPRETKGFFQRLRNITLLVLLGIYYFTPWIMWNGRQAILFDLPARKFHIFGLTMWPQDFFFLTLLLIMAGLSLFFFTALAGRLWCGYACPQTVWTDAFIWMERLVEGSRAQQMKLTKSPWTPEKIRKRVLKQVMWVSFSLWTGFTFVGYFTPIKELASVLWAFDASFWQLFWVLFYGFATYGNAGFLREQVCQYMCPYARFQSAMFDKDTLVIAYDEARGEPRMKGKKRNENADKAGDCIDCGLCVQVCPTGIDIRNGLQYECIACAACIDVCNEVMDSVGKPHNLVQYTTEATTEGRKTKILRLRIVIYASLLGALAIGFLIALMMRSSVQMDILRDRNALYKVISGNQIENTYNLKVMNKSHVDQRYQLVIEGLRDAKVEMVNDRVVKAGEIANITVQVTVPKDKLVAASQTVHLKLSELEGDSPDSITEETRFFGPSQ